MNAAGVWLIFSKLKRKKEFGWEIVQMNLSHIEKIY